MKSTSNKAKNIIRREILSAYNGESKSTRTRFKMFKRDADAGNGGTRGYTSNYRKGAYMVESGMLRIPNHDIAMNFLSKIYGKKKAEKFLNDGKAFNIYKHLIGREYDSMIREQRSNPKAPFYKKSKESKRY
ncbi:hypothetical protein JV173_03355 [Acholeplasma equirhinis]|uniref:hypothetical protein n=1 Tax=Acholeplasma equirhinis TaxID=555393 RepID=UPI00197A7220|nr:hypothetical protein [Acholeplasma equirhinis]MBN3490546.1 hypothetical protein [Acholeplasma equirhinis]